MGYGRWADVISELNSFKQRQNWKCEQILDDFHVENDIDQAFAGGGEESWIGSGWHVCYRGGLDLSKKQDKSKWAMGVNHRN